MTIHPEHPFATPAGAREPLRRLRGRLPSAVSVWTTTSDQRAGTDQPEIARPQPPGPVSLPGPAGAPLPMNPGEWAGLTVSSFVVVPGEPGALVAVVDPDSDFADMVAVTGRVAVSLLSWTHRDVADVHAGLAPSPGGPFRTGRWQQTPWGPVLVDAVAWVGGAVVADSTRDVGWSRLLEVTVEHVHVADSDASPRREPLVHHRGRYERG